MSDQSGEHLAGGTGELCGRGGAWFRRAWKSALKGHAVC